ncbi:hypothetical protein [uncultured Tateyamaria sp.]|uniref:cytochrome c oxidase subunit 3 n=1 Tax=uncultured Tateyamaria sp. TaxID=455651 RepID=UPI00261D6CF2|nr:hypothetical protein [uncultured Tateyamaria sp.]
MGAANGTNMTVILAFLVTIIALAFWWLLQQGVMSKPWLETGPMEEAAGRSGFPVERLGLGVFLVVIGSLFALFSSAFIMRMDLEIWPSLTLPPVVWINTALLVVASIFLRLATRRSDTRRLTRDTTIAGLATGGFLVGQLLAWRELQVVGDGLTSGPAASFFYMLSGLHGLHILGGILALGVLIARSGGDPDRTKLNVGLCATYWDFLLVVWIGLLLLFMGWANQLLDICRTILT